MGKSMINGHKNMPNIMTIKDQAKSQECTKAASLLPQSKEGGEDTKSNDDDPPKDDVED
ncbi:hypothetical protein HAX54_037867, partial [Datura stramonium]|nr:hypothetical protein [Datura stramonium]